MGGGDLNLKKSWHPNTMKNQEMVWKAEKAAAEEQRKIAELQKEREMEHNRIELNTLAKQTAGVKEDGRLSWMYDKPDKKANHEEYLLGKAVDGSFGQPEKEQDSVSAMSRRVAGSSMLTASAGEAQVDLARKMREDPLLLVKERERSARLALLNNPIQRKKLAELLRKEQLQIEQKKEKKTKRKKSELDEKLAEKLNALGGKKGLDLAALLASDDSSSDTDSSSEKKTKKKKKEKKAKKSKKKKRKLERSKSESSLEEIISKKKKKPVNEKQTEMKNKNYTPGSYSNSDSAQRLSRPDKSTNSKYDDSSIQSSRRDHTKDRNASPRSRYSSPPQRHRKEPSSSYADTSDSNRHPYKPYKSQDRERTNDDRYKSQKRSSPVGYRRTSPYQKERKGLSAEEKAARLAEMAQAGAEREKERGVRVAEQRAAIAKEERSATTNSGRSGKEARALPTSLESRIHSNRHNIQRSERHMTEHFARRH